MGLRVRTWAAYAVCGLGFGLGLASGCLLELDRRLSCGDGFVDVLADEECDPGAPNSPHLDACVQSGLGEGTAHCNNDCKIELSKDICQSCGDGIAAGDEQCDTADLKGQVCASGKGELTCTSDCKLDGSKCELCGNNIVDEPLEECDVQRCSVDGDCPGNEICDGPTKTCVDPEDFAFFRDCKSLDLTASLPEKDAYVSGVVLNDDCGQGCLFDRRDCSFCGDGVVDGQYEDIGLNGAILQKAETCDGNEANANALHDHCLDVCTNGSPTTLDLRCDFECQSDCNGFVDTDWPEPVVDSARCCVIGGSPCDVPGGFPCCWELDYNGLPTDACVEFVENNQIVRRCNSKPPDGN